MHESGGHLYGKETQEHGQNDVEAILSTTSL